MFSSLIKYHGITRLQKLTWNEPPKVNYIIRGDNLIKTVLMTEENKTGHDLNSRAHQSSILKNIACTHLATNGVLCDVFWCFDEYYVGDYVCGLWWQEPKVLCRYWVWLHIHSSPKSRPSFIKNKLKTPQVGKSLAFIDFWHGGSFMGVIHFALSLYNCTLQHCIILKALSIPDNSQNFLGNFPTPPHHPAPPQSPHPSTTPHHLKFIFHLENTKFVKSQIFCLLFNK